MIATSRPCPVGLRRIGGAPRRGDQIVRAHSNNTLAMIVRAIEVALSERDE
jgi:hypothetical protein